MDNLSTGFNDAHTYSPLTLAFLGDAVFELMVRSSITQKCNRPAGALHRESVRRVCARAQAAGYEQIRGLLTEEEESVFRRGRNASPSHSPKNASAQDYHYATGLEALFGYLYVKGDFQRLKALFSAIESGDEEEIK